MPGSDDSIVFEVNINPTKAERDLAALQKKIESMENALSENTSKRTSVELSLSAAREQLAKLEAEYTASVLNDVDPKRLKEQEATLAAQDRLVQQLEQGYSEVNKQCVSLQGNLDSAKQRAGELVEQIAQQADSEERSNAALAKANVYMGSFLKRVKRLAKNVFVFSVITMALRSLKNGLVSVIESDEEAAESLAKLKGALLTLAAPIVDVLVPAAKWMINVLTAAITEIIAVVSILSGKSVEEMKKSAKALYDEADAFSAVGSSAKNAAGGLAAFDTITKLSAQSSSISPSFDFSDNEYLTKWEGVLEGINDLFWSIRAGLDIVLDDIEFSLDNGADLSARGTWETVMFALLGATLGAAFGGFSGGIVGVILGAAIGLYLAGIDPENSKQNIDLKDVCIAVLCGLIGAIMGGLYVGPVGAGAGFLLGAILSLYIADFAEGEQINKDKLISTLVSVLCALIGTIIGAAVGGAGGALIGLGLGLVVGLVIDDIKKAEQGDNGSLRNIFISVICTLLGAIVGTVFGPVGTLVGAAVGFSLSLLIRLGVNNFSEGESAGSTERSTALKVLSKILKSIFGSALSLMLSSSAGLVLKIPIGLLISFFTKGVDDSAIESAVAQSAAATQSAVSVQSATAVHSAPASYSVPALAGGAVIPANREFMAILGDQKYGNNIEAPEALIRKIVREESGGGVTELLQDILSAIKSGHAIVVDRREIGRTAAQGINDITVSTGKNPLLI